MSELPDNVQFELEIERSRFLDAHAAVEAAVAMRLQRLKYTLHKLPGQNIDLLAKAKPAPQYSKSTKTRVDAALTQLRNLQDIRNDVVHSEMKIADIEGNKYACFANPLQHSSPCMRPSLVSAQSLREMSRELHRLAREIAPD